MSRTTRSPLTYNRQNENTASRAARLARWDASPPGHYVTEFPGGLYRNRRGGMLMSPSNTGMWSDEYDPGDKRTKRNVKRSERQRVLREAWDEALDFLCDVCTLDS